MEAAVSVKEASATEQAVSNDCGTDPAVAEQVQAGSLAQAVLQKLRSLPPDKQQQVLEFAEFLAHKNAPLRPQRSFIGMFADQGIHITEEEIAEARREMWGNFPREDI
jgi:hypothetical protein